MGNSRWIGYILANVISTVALIASSVQVRF